MSGAACRSSDSACCWRCGRWRDSAALRSAVRRHGWNAETLSLLPLLLLTGAAIVGLPRIFPSGLPVRGYGVMVLAGAASGVWMATYRAQRAGIDREVIWSMAFWLFIGGMVGGRASLRDRVLGSAVPDRQPARDALRVINFPRRRAGRLRRDCSAV